MIKLHPVTVGIATMVIRRSDAALMTQIFLDDLSGVLTRE